MADETKLDEIEAMDVDLALLNPIVDAASTSGTNNGSKKRNVTALEEEELNPLNQPFKKRHHSFNAKKSVREVASRPGGFRIAPHGVRLLSRTRSLDSVLPDGDSKDNEMLIEMKDAQMNTDYGVSQAKLEMWKLYIPPITVFENLQLQHK